MVRPSISRQIFLLIIGIGLLMLAIIGLVAVPAIRDILVLQRYIMQTHAVVEEQYTKTRHLRRSLNEIDQVLLDTAKYAESGLQPGSELELITKLENLAKETKTDQTLRVEYLAEPNKTLVDSFPSITKGPKLPLYVFSITNRGKFYDLLSYIKGVEKLNAYVIIDDIRFEKGKAKVDNTPVPVTMTLTGYVFVNNLLPPGAATNTPELP